MPNPGRSVANVQPPPNPAAPGDRRALTHGAFVEGLVTPRARELAPAVFEANEHLDPERDAAAVLRYVGTANAPNAPITSTVILMRRAPTIPISPVAPCPSEPYPARRARQPSGRGVAEDIPVLKGSDVSDQQHRDGPPFPRVRRAKSAKSGDPRLWAASALGQLGDQLVEHQRGGGAIAAAV